MFPLEKMAHWHFYRRLVTQFCFGMRVAGQGERSLPDKYRIVDFCITQAYVDNYTGLLHEGTRLLNAWIPPPTVPYAEALSLSEGDVLQIAGLTNVALEVEIRVLWETIQRLSTGYGKQERQLLNLLNSHPDDENKEHGVKMGIPAGQVGVVKH